MKHSYLIFLILSVTFNLFSQTKQVELTKEQMYEDFDLFYDIIKDVNPQLVARQKVTGIDVLAEIKKTRKNIDTIYNASSFIELLWRNLMLCNDNHNCTVFSGKNVIDLFNNDTTKILKFRSFFTKVDDDFKNKVIRNYFKFPFYLDYFNGDYYSVANAIITTNGVCVDSIPKGAKILKIAGFSVDSLLNLNFAMTCRWDNILQKKYDQIFAGALLVPISDTIVIEYEKNHSNNKIIFIKDISVFTNSNGKYFDYDYGNGYVDYFSEDELLYIRLPQMLNDKLYIKEIYKKTQNVPVKKVVIDIRQNGGGSDYVWQNILSAIIKEPLDIRSIIGFKYTKRAFKALDIDPKYRSIKTVKIPLLNNEKFGTLVWGGLVKPFENSLAFAGKIYVLQDRMIFSSAGSLSNVAKMSNNIVSVGETTGHLLGFGIAPIFFSLPNTMFSFQLEPVLDLSNIKTSYDFYHDNVEVPVEISVEQRIKYFNSFNNSEHRGIYSKDFLYNHDPVFQKVLELE